MRSAITGRGALLAAMASAVLGAGNASVLPDIRLPSAGSLLPPYPAPGGGRSRRHRTSGAHQPAGSKLWRKASQQKLGLRW